VADMQDTPLQLTLDRLDPMWFYLWPARIRTCVGSMTRGAALTRRWWRSKQPKKGGSMAEVNRIAAVTMTGAERDTGERRPLVCLFVAGLLSEAPHRPLLCGAFLLPQRAALQIFILSQML
jgi:hypothetical protein